MSLIGERGVEKRKSNSILKAENILNQNQKTKKSYQSTIKEHSLYGII